MCANCLIETVTKAKAELERELANGNASVAEDTLISLDRFGNADLDAPIPPGGVIGYLVILIASYLVAAEAHAQHGTVDLDGLLARSKPTKAKPKANGAATKGSSKDIDELLASMSIPTNTNGCKPLPPAITSILHDLEAMVREAQAVAASVRQAKLTEAFDAEHAERMARSQGAPPSVTGERMREVGLKMAAYLIAEREAAKS